MRQVSKVVKQYPSITDEPNYINDIGTKYWIHGALCEYAEKRKVAVHVLVAQLSSGYTNIVVTDKKTGHIVFESQRSEDVAVNIDIRSKGNEKRTG